MKPPKCRLCESAHWLNEPHVFAINSRPAINADAINKPKANERLEPTPKKEASLADGDDDRTGNRRRKVDYNAYMKEYMRKKRAA